MPGYRVYRAGNASVRPDAYVAKSRPAFLVHRGPSVSRPTAAAATPSHATRTSAGTITSASSERGEECTPYGSVNRQIIRAIA